MISTSHSIQQHLQHHLFSSCLRRASNFCCDVFPSHLFCHLAEHTGPVAQQRCVSKSYSKRNTCSIHFHACLCQLFWKFVEGKIHTVTHTAFVKTFISTPFDSIRFRAHSQSKNHLARCFAVPCTYLVLQQQPAASSASSSSSDSNNWKQRPSPWCHSSATQLNSTHPKSIQ